MIVLGLARILAATAAIADLMVVSANGTHARTTTERGSTAERTQHTATARNHDAKTDVAISTIASASATVAARPREAIVGLTPGCRIPTADPADGAAAVTAHTDTKPTAGNDTGIEIGTPHRANQINRAQESAYNPGRVNARINLPRCS